MAGPLDLVDLARILRRITYKPGWTVELYGGDYEGPWVDIRFECPDAYQPDQTTSIRVRSPVPPTFTDADFVEWLLWRIRRVEDHECREWFKVDGSAWADPHRCPGGLQEGRPVRATV